ncbi:MAG: aminopeptidase P family protein [Lachnospiraceae bacterium]|nr:aminopeptidase P family protein [Lachnospiraceae bacterium]
MKNINIPERLAALRSAMDEEQISFFLASSSDPHMSEYVGDYFKVTEYLSGCTSDNVVLLISPEEAWLWTDGRYFISAAKELSGTGITLMKIGEPGVETAESVLRRLLKAGQTLAADTSCLTALSGMLFSRIAASCGAGFRDCRGFIDRIWTDRPLLSSHPVQILPDAVTGASCETKIAELRRRMNGAAALVITKLDELMYLLNLRGRDIACNPVALSFGIVTAENVHLFIQDSERTAEFDAYAAANRITVHPYEAFFAELQKMTFEGPVMLDANSVNFAVWNLLREKAKIQNVPSPVSAMKAVKNATELSRSREAYLLDSAVLCRFLFWIKRAVKDGETVTETSAAAYLDKLRSEIPGYIELSFPTISAYEENAAMAHYSASEEHPVVLKPEGFLLVDSGGQYLTGTTDVTRTIALGALTEEMRRDFTLVAAANLALLTARFPYGCTGRNLDTFARAPLWARGIDFNHGTGHGIGYILNVHEGPQNISWHMVRTRPEAVFEPGMITSDEPGIYREGEYGIRTESIILCEEDETTPFGRFLHFTPLTFAPIDLDAIDPAYMEPADIARLNAYHAEVRKQILPLLADEAEKNWLIEATRAI